MSQAWPLLDHRYRLLGVIGSGGMAVVHRARDELLRRDVAVKVLRDQFAADPAFVQRFREEARNAASLSHPNIAAVFDTGSTDGLEYIVLELVPGANLETILAARGRLPPDEAASIAAAAADALDAAHVGGIVHRDVKPGNLLLGPNGIVKVVDFGIARALGYAHTTRPGLLLGSLPYASPEQVRGETVGPASDVYSLGVVLYEALTGVNPWAGPSELAAALARLDRQPEPPSRLVSEVPPELEAIVMRTLERDPARRYATAAELARDLRAAARRLRPGAGSPASSTARDPAPTTVPIEPWGVAPTRAAPRARLSAGGRRRAASVLVVGALAAALLGAGAIVAGLRTGDDPGEAAISAPAGAVLGATATPSLPSPASAVPTPSSAVPTPSSAVPTTVSPEPSSSSSVAPGSASAVAPRLDPEEVVARFYFLVAEERFDEASALWTDSLRERYPPGEYIDRRFGPSVALEVGRVEEIERDADEATVTVEVTERRSDGDVRRFTGTWDLVLTGEGWLLHDPAF